MKQLGAWLIKRARPKIRRHHSPDTPRRYFLMGWREAWEKLIHKIDFQRSRTDVSSARGV